MMMIIIIIKVIIIIKITKIITVNLHNIAMKKTIVTIIVLQRKLQQAIAQCYIM